ncbi:MAG: hypothetical protein C0498_11070 [Anaerolinea sp.]|nr:hypothetical protein [Anaerolinea sp.]
MYRDPADRLSFGDVVEAPWLFDVYVRHDSAALSQINLKQGRIGYEKRTEPPRTTDYNVSAQATMDPNDVVLTTGTNRLAIVLTDDCELATLAGERTEEGASWGPRGRIMLAALRASDEDAVRVQRGEAEDAGSGRRKDPPLGFYGLPADGERQMPPALVDFNRLFCVQTKSLIGDEAGTPHRVVVALDEEEQEKLARAFAAHLLRVGPVAARNAVRKLSQLWTAGGDAERLRALRAGSEWGDEDKGNAAAAIARVLEEAWVLGVPIFNLIDDAAIRAEAPDRSLRLVADSLRDIERYAREALRLLEAGGYSAEDA